MRQLMLIWRLLRYLRKGPMTPYEPPEMMPCEYARYIVYGRPVVPWSSEDTSTNEQSSV